MTIQRFAIVLTLAALAPCTAYPAQPPTGDSPADHLPANIKRLTHFGERPDWSPDGRKLIFLSKTFGDVMELDLATSAIRNLTAFFPHYGFVRAMYLTNGDILLSGPEQFDPKKPDEARRNSYLFVLDKGLTKPPVALGVRCNEGPATSRKRLHIAWTEWTQTFKDKPPERSEIFEADVVYEDGKPSLANRRSVIDNSAVSIPCTIEVQAFQPPDEKAITFSAYDPSGNPADVCIVDLATKKVTNLTHSADVYDEPEGMFPDGKSTLVECDQQNRQGPSHIDIWRLALDGSGKYERLTHFSDYPNYKASNPVVSDDGRAFAFQMGRAGEAAGVGHGIFLYELKPVVLSQ
jgi:Tol biopolymer transport system component